MLERCSRNWPCSEKARSRSAQCLRFGHCGINKKCVCVCINTYVILLKKLINLLFQTCLYVLVLQVCS